MRLGMVRCPPLGRSDEYVAKNGICLSFLQHGLFLKADLISSLEVLRTVFLTDCHSDRTGMVVCGMIKSQDETYSIYAQGMS